MRAVKSKERRELIRVELTQSLNTNRLHLGRPPADAPTHTAQIITPQNTKTNPLLNFVAPKIAVFSFSATSGDRYFPPCTLCPRRYYGTIRARSAANEVCTICALARVYGVITNRG
uniref:U650p n=1 Tax=Mycobacterium leprae TaxID=1769 RepID=Q50108_MYCLR|nr:u650p [Mycobacterium leprae]